MIKNHVIVAVVALMISLVTTGVKADDYDLPTPLSAKDVELYQQIFALQQDKKWKAADKLIKKLDDDLLLGRVLAQRYLHPTGWRSSYKELRLWLEKYNDHPAASRIYRLSKIRQPKGAKRQKTPKKGYLNGYGRGSHYSGYVTIPTHKKGRASPAKTRKIARDIRSRIRSGWPTGGLNLLTKQNLRYLTKFEEAVLRADISHGYFIYGKGGKAIIQAQKAIDIAGAQVPQAYWTAGISAWRRGDIPLALSYFDVLANDKDAPASLVAGAAFWASHAVLKNSDGAGYFNYLEIASKYQDSFYGILATVALGQDINLDFNLPTITPSYINWLLSKPGGARAFALLQVGEAYHAERELRYLWAEMNEEQHLQAMSLAAQAHMAGLSYRLAGIIQRDVGKAYYGGLYPIPNFKLNQSIKIDKALLISVMRQESGFNPRAKSSAKAQGLMQLLPSTAAFVTQDRNYRGKKKHDLLLPDVNIEIGERYILHLLGEKHVEMDLVKLLAAYNGGPGNLKKWMNNVNHQDDVLLLLESLPSRETRLYVKNVMKNLWIYRQQLGEETPILDNFLRLGEATFSERSATHGDSCDITRLSEQC